MKRWSWRKWNPQDFAGAMELAAGLKITFHDASHLHATKKGNLTLVTEDGELREKARQAGIKALTVNELEM